MAIMYIMVGNIGTGKSTTSKLLMADDTMYVSEDLIAPMMTDGRYDQGVWTPAHFRIYRKVKLAAADSALQNGYHVIVDGTNIAVENRAKYIEVAKKHKATVIVYTFLDAKFGLENRLRNHRGTPPEAWQAIHDELERKFELPVKDEGIDKIIVIEKHPPAEHIPDRN